MSINKSEHQAKKSGRNRDKSKSSDHFRQPYGSSSINDYDLVIDQEDVRPIVDLEDEEEQPAVMIVSEGETLRAKNYTAGMLQQPQRNEKIEMIQSFSHENNIVNIQGGSKSKLFAPLPQ